jgi:hypothetical protein
MVVIETYWKFQPNSHFHVTPSAQFLRNDDELEVGLRVFFGFNRGWSGSILGGG